MHTVRISQNGSLVGPVLCCEHLAESVGCGFDTAFFYLAYISSSHIGIFQTPITEENLFEELGESWFAGCISPTAAIVTLW